MLELVIAPDDPRADDITALLERHLQFARSCTPSDFVFALGIDELVQPGITVCSARRDGVRLAVGALSELDSSQCELKSMHTSVDARRQGVAASLVEHLVGLARRRGYDRISLETGSQAEFEPARNLYRRAGFVVCGPFAGYPDTVHSVFMTMALEQTSG